jgi:hypothetical protein
LQFEHLTNQISNFTDTSPLNSAKEIGLNKIFDDPLLGFADASDPLFDRLKKESVLRVVPLGL